MSIRAGLEGREETKREVLALAFDTFRLAAADFYRAWRRAR